MGLGRAAPGTRRSQDNGNGQSESWVPMGWRGGSGGGGRREPVPGGLAAASMPRTPPPPDPPRLRRISAICSGSTPCADAPRQCRPNEERSDRLLLLILFCLSWLAAAGTCPWPGGWAAQGRKRHGWRARAYRDVFTASPAQPTHPANPHKSAVSDQPPSHEGAPPLAADCAPARSARIPEPCACSRIDHAIDDNVVPTWRRTLSPASQVPPSGPSRRLPRRRPDLRHARRHRGPRAL